nr:heparinase II/III family protein [Pseudomonas sp.]
MFTYKSLSGLIDPLAESNSDTSVALRKDLPPCDFSLPFDWATDPFGDTNWCFQLHCWRAGDHRLKKYFETGDPEHMSYVASIMLDWHRFHYIEGKSSSHAWYDMATGIRASRLAHLISTAETSPEIRKILESNDQAFAAMIGDHIRELTDPAKLNSGNHGIFQMSGLMSLCLATNHTGAALEYCVEHMRSILGGQFTAEGIHTENSPEYHYFVLSTLDNLRVFDLFSGAMCMQSIEKARLNKQWFVCPDKSIAAFGDTVGRGPVTTTAPEPKRIILNDGEKHAIGDFSSSGYLFCRSEPYSSQADYFAVTASGHTSVHKHGDPGSFVFWRNGVEIFVDGGKYKYGASPARQAIISAASHSIVDSISSPFDASSFRLPPTGTYATGVTFSESSVALHLEFTTKEGLHFRRAITYQPGSEIMVVDSLPDGSADDIISRLQVNADLTIEKIREDLVSISSENKTAYVLVRGSGPIAVETINPGRSKAYGQLIPVKRLSTRSVDGKKISWKITLH